MNKRVLWSIELLVWFFLITGTILGIHFYQVTKTNKENTYHIFLHDVNGLEKGSPIKIMGVQVGYVTEINVVDDYVYVSFLVSKPNIKIPHGAIANIESSGIAGSKSIELYPPENKADTTKPVIIAKEPIRTSSSFNSSGSIAKTLISIAEGTVAKLKTKTTEQHQQNIQNLTDLTTHIELNSINNKTESIMIKLQEDIKKRTQNDENNVKIEVTKEEFEENE